MKDELGQERGRITRRETLIAVLWVATVGIGIATVALPALDGDRGDAEPGTSAPATPAAPDESEAPPAPTAAAK